MRNLLIPGTLICLILSGCGSHQENKAIRQEANEAEPQVREDGKYVEFPEASRKVAIFKSETAENKKLNLSFSAPANVVGRVHSSSGKELKKIQ